MTPKQKAESLVREYSDITLNVEADDYINQYTAKECALIAVDLVLKNCVSCIIYYWQEVKQEIEKL